MADELSVLTITFTDNSKMQFALTQDAGDRWDAGRKIKEIMEKSFLAFETDEGLFVVPHTNIRHVHLNTPPQVVPEYVLRGARLLKD